MQNRKKIATDLEVLEAIYGAYYAVYAGANAGLASETASRPRESRVYFPIDIPALARALNTDVDLLFGRLYYHLQAKYGSKDGDSEVPFFAPVAGELRNCVHFPRLEAVLAELREEDKKYRVATWMAGISLGLSLLAVVVSALT